MFVIDVADMTTSGERRHGDHGNARAGAEDGEKTNSGRDTVFCISTGNWILALTVLELDLVALEAFGLPALAVADDLRLPGSLLVTPALRFRRLEQAVAAAALSQSACAGTSDHAAPPYKQMTQQSPPFASDLPAADDRTRPCWSGAYECHTPAGLV